MKITKWSETERQRLVDILPLKIPLTIQIEPSSACNFKCFYCQRQDGKHILKNSNLKYDSFKLLVDQLVKCNYGKVKTLMFVGLGEPLLNKDLPNMIKLAKDNKVCNIIKVITNGSLLSEETNIRLIDSGLDVLRISLQGLTDKEYFDVCGVNVDFNKMIENIKHFYENKKNCKVFIKILDKVLGDRKDEFFDMFSGICDEIAIEHLVDYESTNNKNIWNEESLGIDVCPYPFYQMYIDSEANIRKCIEASGSDEIIGNLHSDNCIDVWNSKEWNEFRIMLLNKKRYTCNLCKNCKIPDVCSQKTDYLDDYSDDLIEKYK